MRLMMQFVIGVVTKIALAVCSLAAATSAASADQIWIAPPSTPASSKQASSKQASSKPTSWYAEPIVRRETTIVSWDRQRVVTQNDNENVQQSYPASRIVHVAAKPLNAPEQTLVDAINAGDDIAVLRSLTAAIQSRPPVWRQQWYTVWAIESLVRTGRMKIAYNLIQQIDALELPPVVIARLPIAWAGVPLTSDTSAVDHDHLQSRSAAASLVAASRLLDVDPTQAVETLSRLSKSSTRPTAASLATIMLKIAQSGDNIGDDWQSHLETVDAMPIGLQDGPVAMLAIRCRRTGATAAADQLDQRRRYASVLTEIPAAINAADDS